MEEKYQRYIARTPSEKRYILEKKLDYQHDGVEKDLEKIADAFVDWEINLATLLELKQNPDVRDILAVNQTQPILQRRAALRSWKQKKGLDATYGRLLRICLEGKNEDSAEVIVQLLGAGASNIPEAPITGNVNEFSTSLSADQLAQWLQSKDVPEEDCEKLRVARISGRLFMSLTEEKLSKYKIELSPVGLDTIEALQEEIKAKSADPGVKTSKSNQDHRDTPNGQKSELYRDKKFDLREVALHCLKDLSAKLYPDLALELGLKAADVDKFEADHPKNSSRVLQLIIQAWIDRSDDNYKPSWLFLKGALQKMGQKDIADTI